MSDNINDKNSPNQMRILMKRMRDGKYEVNEVQDKSKKDMSMRDMLKITRNLNEDVDTEQNEPNVNREVNSDQKQEEEKIRNLFKDMTVDIRFEPDALKVTNDYITFGGTIDGVIQFIYNVTPDETTSEVKFNYLPTINHDNPDNEEIVKRIEGNYDTFYKYWRDNILQ